MFGRHTRYNVFTIVFFEYMGGIFSDNTVIGLFDHYREATHWAKKFEKVAQESGMDARTFASCSTDSKGELFVFDADFATTLNASETTPEMVIEDARKLVEWLQTRPLSM